MPLAGLSHFLVTFALTLRVVGTRSATWSLTAKGRAAVENKGPAVIL